MAYPVVISIVVEGDIDAAAARKLVLAVGAQPGPVYGREGKQALLRKLAGYNNAARHTPWLVLVDLDRDAECAPLIRPAWLWSPAPYLCFRIVVRAVEAWLMADAQTLAAYLGVAPNRVPPLPESLDSPKAELVNLARLSRKRSIHKDMVPPPGGGRSVGPAYPARLIEYIQDHWRPEEAARRSASLQRALACLRRLVENYSTTLG